MQIKTKAQTYMLRTRKVEWEKNKSAFLHIFTNTTIVREFEEQKAVNKFQNLLMYSVSHELRTPLNIIQQSAQIVGNSFKDIKS